jgi:hypothetical protein
MADKTYDEKKDAMRREAQAEEAARQRGELPPRGRILGQPDADGLLRFHPDDLFPFEPGIEQLRRGYAPTLAEFEKKYGRLPEDSVTRKTYLKAETGSGAAPAQTPAPTPPTTKK